MWINAGMKGELIAMALCHQRRYAGIEYYVLWAQGELVAVLIGQHCDGWTGSANRVRMASLGQVQDQVAKHRVHLSKWYNIGVLYWPVNHWMSNFLYDVQQVARPGCPWSTHQSVVPLILQFCTTTVQHTLTGHFITTQVPYFCTCHKKPPVLSGHISFANRVVWEYLVKAARIKGP